MYYTRLLKNSDNIKIISIYKSFWILKNIIRIQVNIHNLHLKSQVKFEINSIVDLTKKSVKNPSIVLLNI